MQPNTTALCVKLTVCPFRCCCFFSVPATATKHFDHKILASLSPPPQNIISADCPDKRSPQCPPENETQLFRIRFIWNPLGYSTTTRELFLNFRKEFDSFATPSVWKTFQLKLHRALYLHSSAFPRLYRAFHVTGPKCRCDRSSEMHSTKRHPQNS